ncbi:cyclic nucleotide-binding domain-containing protein [Loktanella sp. SALINAS62]|uniref:cyclic nucleotide-binding domain-containing protein n=1 Tax=Loktanella sp. SALINAS62 TaxID=2706124 RepID=UPI001B8CD699|nr:cyclic nucleotide-binding domain-containing protein [Loktanella sp. SALINAS62]MBS1304283.1 cyclic nucleotide-binding domain-containing protein [Loktanella sp. SALINAS62]
MSFEVVDLIGFAASALVFLTFCMQTLLPLRIIAIASNILFIAYGISAGLVPILILHAVLLPVNIWRTVQQIQMRHRVRGMFNKAPDTDMLLPFMTATRFAAGAVVFRRCDQADRLFVVLEGEVRVEEFECTINKGEIFGEIGLFSAEGRRNATVRAVGPVSVAWIDRANVIKLFQDQPDFAIALTRLMTSRLSENQHSLSARLASTV